MTGQDRCGGIEPVTPVEESNRPGLAALNYRVGAHGQFLATMLARLSSTDHPELRAFTARDTGDLAVALLDGWATVADVLSFYTERLANEGFLRTALDQQSIALLGKLVGYAPRPGVGASTYLAYTVDDSAPRFLIPAGSKAQNVPTGGSIPQTYETTADLIASADWNDFPVRTSKPTGLTRPGLIASDSVFLAGTATNLKPNDRLLFDFGPAAGLPVVKPVVAVRPDQIRKRTEVDFVVETPDQAYQEAVENLVAALEELASTDPILRNAHRWIVAPLEAAIGDVKGNRNPPDVVGPALRTALRELAEEIVVAQVRGDEAADPLATLASVAGDTFAAALRADPVGAAANPIRPLDQTKPTGPVAAASPIRSLDGTTQTGPVGGDAVSGLSGLLGPLRLPPSVQPPNSAALTRSATSAFAPGSDNSIGLLTAADPRLAAQLYTALSNADLTPAPNLRGLQAMRVTAAPFGATAPLKPVTDNEGRVVDHTEWPFAQTANWSVTFDDVFDPVNTQTASFVVGYSDGTADWVSPDVQLNANLGELGQTVPVGPDAQADCTLTSSGSGESTAYRLDVVLTAGQVTRTLTIGLPHDTTDTVDFEITDAANNSVALRVGNDGQPVYGKVGDDSVTAVWSTDEGGPQLAQARRTEISAQGSIPMTVTDFLAPRPTLLDLDAIYPGIVPGSWIVVERPTEDAGTGPIKVVSVNTVSVASYGLTGKVTQLVLDRPWLDGSDLTLAPVRRTTIRAQGDPLRLAETPIAEDIAGDFVDLAGSVNGLRTGRWLIVAGDRTDLPDNTVIPAGELVMLAGTQQVLDSTLPGDKPRTRLTFANRLAYTYQRDTVHVYGNVVAADQGSSRTEPIGSGDATATGQTFSLSSTPLTYLPADNPDGAANTLVLRVNGVQWHETDTLATAGPTDHSFVLTNGAKTTVTFGDGVHGARLPTGVENVTATYRTGLGLAGNVPAGTITQPTSRPAGVRQVNNPLAATGGADADPSSVARVNTPLRTYALDRLVSVQDYADFSAARAGIGRASARRLSDGTRDVLHLTITGVNDAPIDPSDELVRTLRESLADFGDAHLPVVVAVRDLVLLVLSANIKVLPDYRWPLVEPLVRNALLTLFSAAGRDLGQPAYASEAISAIQAVPGVDYVDLDVFTGIRGSITPDELNGVAGTFTVNPVVAANLADYQEEWHVVAGGDTLTSIATHFDLSVTELVRLNPWLPDAELPGSQLPPVEMPDPLRLMVRRGIAPAQLAVLSPDVPDSLILKENTS